MTGVRRRPRRIFIGFAEISGYYGNLARGFEAHGVRCTFVDLTDNPFGFARPEQSRVVKVAETASRRRHASGRRSARLAWTAPVVATRLMLFLWAIARHDTFIFGFGTSFFRQRELRLLRLLRKRLIFQFHGSDARPPYIDGAVHVAPRDLVARAADMKARLRRIDRWADVVVNNPTHAHLHEREIVVWLRLGIPTRPAGNLGSTRSASDAVRVLHCPSDLAAKGTPEIRTVIRRLTERGLPIEYVEVTGRPHAEVVRELQRCDLVIDQLYADYGMPGFATEAAWLGKPVVIGGFAVDFWDRLLGPDALPTCYCSPEELEANIERLVIDAAERSALGERARSFVESHWSPVDVAARYLQLATGDIPRDWVYDPAELDYVAGCGLRREELRERLAAVVAVGGAKALQLSDKPRLEGALVAESRLAA